MFVYIISDGEFCKVGISMQPKVRLLDLQTANPRLLKLAYSYRVPDEVEARRMETQMHMTLSERGLYAQGEWFRIDSTEAAAIYRGLDPRWIARRAKKRLGRTGWTRKKPEQKFESSLNRTCW